MDFHFKPATSKNWKDLELLFGKNGACGGCWCMLRRCSKKEYDQGKGAGNRTKMKRLTESGMPPGIVGYEQNKPIAWCSIGPRTDFQRLESSRILKPVDNEPVWSVTCIFIDKEFRRKGYSTKMLEFAKQFARDNGAKILEAYPQEPEKTEMPDVFAWTGIASSYTNAGFEEVARRSEKRPIMRVKL